MLGVPIAEIARLLQAHLLLSASAVGLALLIGLPLAILAARHARLATPLLAVVSVVQTVPGLALLALFYPLLLLAARLTGFAIPALGFLPALLALTLYALLPIVRNGVAALRGIDPTLIEAADGLGMTGLQRLRFVELPLAAPVMLAGIRTASVWTIGTATLATTIGQPSLGDLIFSGLQTEDWRRVIAGCIAAASLALAVDFALGQIERGLARRSRGPIVLGLAVLFALLVAALLPPAKAADRPVIVGAKNFSEQYILASLIESRLQAAGFQTERRDNLGSAIAYRALAAGDIDVYVDYGGTLWANVLGRKDTPTPDDMRETLAKELRIRDGVLLRGSLGFENAYAFAMKAAEAEAHGIADLSDLAREASHLRLGTDLEFLNRPEWQSVKSAYGPNFLESRSYSPTFMYRALTSGAADVITAFSSDGRITAFDLVLLDDPQRALPPYEALLLLSPPASHDQAIADALRPLLGAISPQRMREANWMVDRDAGKKTPEEAAAWLDANLGKPPM